MLEEVGSNQADGRCLVLHKGMPHRYQRIAQSGFESVQL